MYDLRRRNLNVQASSNKRPSQQTLHVRIPVKLHIELDVPTGGFASPSDTGIWLLSDL